MATLVFSDSDGRDRSFALGTDPVTVGRAPECTIRSDDPRVSRMHARFFLDQGGLWIEDLGSTHGIYVGAQKVQRALVPPGEVVLIGSLLIRLVPASGTMPPPIGLHGTLATWLDLERKTRVAVEEERDAFAKRVGELHQEIAAARNAPATTTLKPGDTTKDLGNVAEAIRMRDEAEARAAALERALAAVQDELMVLRSSGTNPDADLMRLRTELAAARERLVEQERDLADRAEWSNLVGADVNKLTKELDKTKVALDEARSAQSIAEHAHGEAARESQSLREEIDRLRRSSTADLEAVRGELAKAREGQMVVATSAGMNAAEKLAELDLEIETLKRQLAEARAAPAQIVPVESDARVQELTEQIAQLTGRADKAEKELAAAQIRAQGAERNLTHANSQAAKAETRAAQLEQRLADADASVKLAEDEATKARERITALEARLGAGDKPLQAAETRAGKLADELAAVTAQVEAGKAKIAELEGKIAAAEQAKRDTETRGEAVRAEVAAAQQKLADAEKRATQLQAKLDDLAKAESAIAAATKRSDDAATRVTAAEKQVAEAIRRAEDAEKRASAADTMAKAMAKDVAEALRRAADADTQKRAGAREAAELTRRVEQAEAANATSAATIKAAEDKAAEAEARTEQLRKELTEQLEATQKELGAKLEAAQRELAAERKGLLALVDRKTQLERELVEARAQLPELRARAEAAEQRVVEHEVQIETLQDRVDDLESSLAVAETAREASLGEAGERVAALEKQLVEERQAAGKGGELIGELRAQIETLENKLAAVEKERDDAREDLARSTREMQELVRAAEARATSTDDERERLADALRRATDAERKVDALAAQAETAELAIGRAGALQRQLDEALSKLAFLERDTSRPREAPRPEVSDAIANDRIAAAEIRTKEVERQLEEMSAQLAEADRRAKEAHDQIAQAHAQLAELQRRAKLAEDTVARAGDAERRAQAAEQMIEEAERRAEEAEMQVTEMSARLAELQKRPPAGNDAFERQLFDAQRKIAELEREVANADNVRSFAAETEREIAQLQRDLRDARTKLTQMTLERDRLASDLRDARGDSETTNRRAPLDRDRVEKAERDDEVTAQADISKYEPIIKKAQELEKKLADTQRQNTQLRAQLADTEQRLRDAIDRDDEGSEATHTGSQLPIAFAEYLNVLEESIDSLRANMRAASDETAMMEQSDSVVAVSSAVSQAAEHIERARAALRAMNSAIGIG